MDMLRGNSLINYKQEVIVANDALRETQYIGLYFTAWFCSPCEIFLPLLKKVYEKVRETEIKFDIVYIPSDHDDDDVLELFNTKHGPWYAMPIGPTPQAIRKKYHVVSLPTVIIVDKEGLVITKNGRTEVEEHPDEILSLWFPDYKL